MVQVGFGPLWRIDGPPPQAPQYTLIGAARVVEDVDGEGIDRWINGVKVYAFPPDGAHVHDACAGGSSRVKADGGTIPLPEFGALTVYLAETCSSQGIFGGGLSNEEAQRRFTARAVSVLSAVESAAVEREFLAGDVLGNNPHLADGQGTFPWGDNATSVVNGVAVLENEIAVSGRQGMIHVSPGLAVAAANNRLIERASDGRLRTINGTIVVPGYGYAGGQTPAGGHPDAAGSEEWVYATGPVEVRRSEVFVVPENLAQALDRGENEITYRAERYYIVDWDTAVQAAVLIDRCTTECGSAPS